MDENTKVHVYESLGGHVTDTTNTYKITIITRSEWSTEVANYCQKCSGRPFDRYPKRILTDTLENLNLKDHSNFIAIIIFSPKDAVSSCQVEEKCYVLSSGDTHGMRVRKSEYIKWMKLVVKTIEQGGKKKTQAPQTSAVSTIPQPQQSTGSSGIPRSARGVASLKPTTKPAILASVTKAEADINRDVFLRLLKNRPKPTKPFRLLLRRETIRRLA